MKTLFKMINVRDFLFGILIFALVILISIFQPSNKVLVEFSDTAADVKTGRYTMNIPYDMIGDIELTDKPDMGEAVDGHDDMILLTGTWKNDAWGEYHACVEIETDNCIVLRLTDGQIFVISRRDNEETGAVYEEFLSHMK